MNRRLKRHYILTMCCLLAGLACKKVVNVDLKNATPQIVIEGEVIDEPGPYYVKITKTVDFSATNTYPPVSGATVTITDSNTHVVYPLVESQPGLYLTNGMQGVQRHTYQLSVMAEGKVYTASSTMPALVPLDSITFARNVDFRNKTEINAVVNFQDPPGLGNYYQFVEYDNGKLIPNTFVFEDRLSDGRYIKQSLYNDSTYMQAGDTLKLKMFCIDKATYDYFFSFIQVTGNNSFQSATPANPNTNISNGALGYFSAHTNREYELRIY